MDDEHAQNLVRLVEHLATALNRSEATIANRAGVDGKFFVRLRGGKSCRLDTYAKLSRWFSHNWPETAAWPAGVPRAALLTDQRDAA